MSKVNETQRAVEWPPVLAQLAYPGSHLTILRLEKWSKVVKLSTKTRRHLGPSQVEIIGRGLRDFISFRWVDTWIFWFNTPLHHTVIVNIVCLSMIWGPSCIIIILTMSCQTAQHPSRVSAPNWKYFRGLNSILSLQPHHWMPIRLLCNRMINITRRFIKPRVRRLVAAWMTISISPMSEVFLGTRSVLRAVLPRIPLVVEKRVVFDLWCLRANRQWCNRHLRLCAVPRIKFKPTPIFCDT